jgi:hypothetical protein
MRTPTSLLLTGIKMLALFGDHQAISFVLLIQLIISSTFGLFVNSGACNSGRNWFTSGSIEGLVLSQFAKILFLR